MTPKIKVLHVMKEFSAPTQTFIYDLVLSLENDSGIDNTIFAYKRRSLQEERPFPKVILGKEIAKSQLSPLTRITLKLTRKDAVQTAFKHFLQKFKPDVIHCHFAWSYTEFVYQALAAQEHAIPTVISTHGTDLAKALQNETSKRILCDEKNGGKVVFAGTTEYMSGLLANLGIPTSRSFIIPNSVNPLFFKSRKDRFFKTNDCFRIINNSRLVHWKGQEYLIKAFGRFRKEVYPNSTLTLIGDGPCLEKLKTLASSLDLSDAIRFTGNKKHKEIPEILREHDLYVQPSIIDEETGQLETFGVAVLEAIAVGLPVIVTNTGGMPYLIGKENEFAHVVPFGNVDALFLKMKQLFEQGVMSHDNARYAEERVAYYSQQNQKRACIDVYHHLLNIQ